ncbi:MAG: hypothetical protein B6227_06220 [Fusobacteriia bacterium 4572_74]|nr:MAG: hypothetical protein B6227_06220 [Fusobacteriia bacterium 4572_74]
MIQIKREEIIKSILEIKKTVTLKELIEKLKTSESTIRRDLARMEENGILTRVHGGASISSISYEEDLISKINQNNGAKEDIAFLASTYIKENDCIFLDAGTTTEYLIKHMRSKDVTVVTNGIHHIKELSKYKIKSYFTGGALKHKTGALIGKDALKTIESYNYDISFIGSNSIDIKTGLTTPDPDEALIKERVIQNSKVSYILADHTKFNKISFSKFGNLKEVKIITDTIIDERYRSIKTIEEVIK